MGMPIRKTLYVAVIVLPLSAGIFLHFFSNPKPPFVYLTWQDDPSTSITVSYQSMTRDETAVVYYDLDSQGGDRDAYRYSARGESHQIEGLPDGRWIHHVALDGLRPGTSYYFVAGSEGIRAGGERKFRTLPDDGSPIRFVSGGDNRSGRLAAKLKREAARRDPHFVVIGGDLAYANGDFERIRRWNRWLRNWQDHMITPDGYTIPLVAAIGNHETNRDYGVDEPEKKAPFYFGFFAQGGATYFHLPIGRDGGLIVLDSDHITPHAAQVAWLEETLQHYGDRPHRIAVYHVPFFPTYRSFLGADSVAGREHWQPLFDEYNLTVAFENHDHTFKRSKLIRGNEVDPEGVLYLGDGNMGVTPRPVQHGDEWYIAKASSESHFWVVDIDGEAISFEAVDARGRVFDRYPEEEAVGG